MFSPSSTSRRYSSSFPSSPASAIVTWIPRTSSGSFLGFFAAVACGDAGFDAAGDTFAAATAASSSWITNLAPAARLAVTASRNPTATARRRLRLRRAFSRRARKRSFGSICSNSIDTGAERYVENVSFARGP